MTSELFENYFQTILQSVQNILKRPWIHFSMWVISTLLHLYLYELATQLTMLSMQLQMSGHT